MLSYALLVHAAPYSTQGALSALRFAEAAIARGHRVETVFFYHDGVHNASTLMAPPQDEAHLGERWKRLGERAQTTLLVCVAAGLRRGVIDAKEAARHDLSQYSVEPPFTLTGIGQLVDAVLTHDRLITFPP